MLCFSGHTQGGQSSLAQSTRTQNTYISCSSYTDYLKKAFSTIKWSTDWKKVDDAVRHLDNALKYEANDMPYSALSEIKEIFPERSDER